MSSNVKRNGGKKLLDYNRTFFPPIFSELRFHCKIVAEGLADRSILEGLGVNE